MIARRLVAIALAALPLATGIARASDGEPRSFDYLYVEANEGGSSGGHAAIRFGAETYHFQFHAGGVLRLERVDSASFVRTYALLQNRTIHVEQVAVSPATYALLRDRFNDRYLREEREFAQLALLEEDRDLLARLAGSEPGPATVALPGGGLFAPAPPGATPDPAIAAVLARARARYGPDVVARRRAAGAAALAALLGGDGTRAAGAPGEVLPSAVVANGAPLAQRAAEVLEASAALDALEGRTALRADAIRDDRDDASLTLAPEEAAALRAFAARLEERAVELLGATRPDWGSALLLALARLATLARSTAPGRLVVLDAFPDDAERLEPDTLRAEADLLPMLRGDARADLASARRALHAPRPLGEPGYTTLETAANRYLELARAGAPGASVRVARGPLLPSRAARRALPDPGAAQRVRLAGLAAAAAARVDAAREELRARYAYDLLGRNCVSEIFREIAAALAPGGDAGGAIDCSAERAALGGCIDPATRLRFIPFVSADAVAAEYRVTASREVPSLRAAALAAMYRRENALAVFLRESNVLTSTIYRRNPDDSAFLFFTDDEVLTRPLFGAANLLTALGASIAGLALLPAGDPALLESGLRGALFSVPELAFLNVRKGSFVYAPRVPGGTHGAGGT